MPVIFRQKITQARTASGLLPLKILGTTGLDGATGEDGSSPEKGIIFAISGGEKACLGKEDAKPVVSLGRPHFIWLQNSDYSSDQP